MSDSRAKTDVNNVRADSDVDLRVSAITPFLKRNLVDGYAPAQLARAILAAADKVAAPWPNISEEFKKAFKGSIDEVSSLMTEASDRIGELEGDAEAAQNLVDSHEHSIDTLRDEIGALKRQSRLDNIVIDEQASTIVSLVKKLADAEEDLEETDKELAGAEVELGFADEQLSDFRASIDSNSDLLDAVLGV